MSVYATKPKHFFHDYSSRILTKMTKIYNKTIHSNFYRPFTYTRMYMLNTPPRALK